MRYIETEAKFDGNPVYEKDDTLLVVSTKSILYREDMAVLDPEFMVVASRHRSERGDPTLTAHVTGNFGEADVGGKKRRLSIAPALLLSQAAELLKQSSGCLDHKVSLEVTHHGPSEMQFPIVYVEVGSCEEQWLDDRPCTVVAEVIDRLVSESLPDRPSTIGFGGPHYAPNFTEITSNVAVGHIAPKYVIENVDEEMIEQMIRKTTPKPEFAVLDWKGLRSGEKTRITSILEQLGVAWRKTSELK